MKKGEKMLGLTESFATLKGLPVADYKVVKSENDLLWNFPYFMKTDSAEHKTEIKGVAKCRNEKEAIQNYKAMRKKFRNKIIIQESIDGVEMILGIKKDKVFEKLLMIGFGGINAEILRDVSFRALPVEKEEIEKMIKELKFYSILVKRKKYAVEKIVEIAEKISKLNVEEMDLNPVIVDEKNAWIVDARVLI